MQDDMSLKHILFVQGASFGRMEETIWFRIFI